MNTITIGTKIEGAGSRRDRGQVVETDTESQRARIEWTERRNYTVDFVGNNWRTRTTYSGEFTPYATKQPRTWQAIKNLSSPHHKRVPAPRRSP